MGIEIDGKYIYLENNCLIPPDLKKDIDEKIKRSYIKTSKLFWENNQD